MARKPKAGLNGTDRLAYLGFTNVWFGRQYDAEYNARRHMWREGVGHPMPDVYSTEEKPT